MKLLAAVALSSVGAMVSACGDACGPAAGEVARVVDGDTIVLRSGETVRYLLADTPEIAEPPECYGVEARLANVALVSGKGVNLRYDAQCEDRYGRLLAFVSVAGRAVNQLLVESGLACALRIPPNGAEEWPLFQQLEATARESRRGLWAACERDPPC